MEELETELEAERSAKTDAEVEDDFEYEEEDTIPKKDNADKTRPQKRKKRRLVQDVNGELSSNVLLSQLKRLRNNLNSLKLQDGQAGPSGVEAGVKEGQAKELLHKLQSGREHTAEYANEDVPDTASKGKLPADSSDFEPSRIDARLEVLEKYVGANEADVEEVGDFR